MDYWGGGGGGGGAGGGGGKGYVGPPLLRYLFLFFTEGVYIGKYIIYPYL